MIWAQSAFACVDGEKLASDVHVHLVSEPALFDRFMAALHALVDGHAEQAELGAIAWR